jgi:hypothetical protein
MTAWGFFHGPEPATAATGFASSTSVNAFQPGELVLELMSPCGHLFSDCRIDLPSEGLKLGEWHRF